MYTRAMEMRSKWITVGLALLAATAFALAVQTAWWHIAEATVGPYGSRNCFGGECRGGGLAWISTNDLWMRSAVSTRAAGYIAMFALIIVAGGAAARRVPLMFARASIVAIIVATVAGITFFVKFPGGMGPTSYGAGPIFFLVGIVSGVAAAIMVMKSAR
jgi:hypothetical protein